MDKREESYPKEGETWYHPLTRNEYEIHSLSNDGWVRIFVPPISYPMYTMETLTFMNIYKRKDF